MAKDLANVRIYGDEPGGVWTAPKGSTGPDDLTTPVDPFVELGWLSEDGVGASRDMSPESFRAWQGAKIVRRKVTSVEDTFSFQCLEENAVTMGLQYRGQPITETALGSGVARIDVKNQTRSDERAWIVDVVDGDVTKRYVIPTGEAIADGDQSHTNGDMTVMGFTLTPTGDYWILTNAPAVVAGAEPAA